MPDANVHQLRHITSDGVSLVIDQYAVPPTSHAHVLVVHGYLEHAGRYRQFAEALQAQGIGCSVLELRGHGRSTGPRAHVESFSRYVDDVAEVHRLLRSSLPQPPSSFFVFGHSLGGLIASHYAQQHGRELSGVLLSNPYLGNAVPIPRAKQWLGRVAHRLAPKLKAPAGLKREWMSRDKAALEAMAQDDSIQRYATAGWFHQVSLAQKAVTHFRKWDCPAWFGIGDADPVASPDTTRTFAEQLSTPNTCIRLYPDALHELLQDTVAQQVHADVIQWLRTHIASRTAGDSTSKAANNNQLG